MLLIPIETLRYERDCLRKAREAHLIHKAKTIEPLGMNKRDESIIIIMYLNIYLFFRFIFLSSHTSPRHNV